jgi:hypothetical protein
MARPEKNCDPDRALSRDANSARARKEHAPRDGVPIVLRARIMQPDFVAELGGSQIDGAYFEALH